MVPMLALVAGLIAVYVGFCVLVGSFIAAGGAEPEDGDLLWPH